MYNRQISPKTYYFDNTDQSLVSINEYDYLKKFFTIIKENNWTNYSGANSFVDEFLSELSAKGSKHNQNCYAYRFFSRLSKKFYSFFKGNLKQFVINTSEFYEFSLGLELKCINFINNDSVKLTLFSPNVFSACDLELVDKYYKYMTSQTTGAIKAHYKKIIIKSKHALDNNLANFLANNKISNTFVISNCKPTIVCEVANQLRLAEDDAKTLAKVIAASFYMESSRTRINYIRLYYLILKDRGFKLDYLKDLLFYKIASNTYNSTLYNLLRSYYENYHSIYAVNTMNANTVDYNAVYMLQIIGDLFSTLPNNKKEEIITQILKPYYGYGSRFDYEIRDKILRGFGVSEKVQLVKAIELELKQYVSYLCDQYPVCKSLAMLG